MGKKIQCIGRYAMDGVTLGKGNFAHVELATHGVINIKVAIKIIDTRKVKDEYQRANLHREARIMAILRHPNIIRLYETLKATSLYCLVTEYANGGELLAFIKSQKDSRLTESAARTFVRQLVSAVHYIHERGIVHRDLKMENIMLDEKHRNLKLIDFGLSNIYKADEPLKTRCGSPEYAAPELFVVGKTYGPEIDIWSIGIVMYAMVIGRLPFFSPFKDEYHRQRMLRHIQKGLSMWHEREMQILSADCRSLIHQLIEPNPELRIPLLEIEVHAWITKTGKCPFVPFVPPERNRNMRSQVIAELATLMDMKRSAVSETVKEHRADELSAMFNMLMDVKRTQHGFFDIDHTRQPAAPDRTTRSRSTECQSPEPVSTTAGLDTSRDPQGPAALTTISALCVRPLQGTLPVSTRSRLGAQPPRSTSANAASKTAATNRKCGVGTKAKPKNRPPTVTVTSRSSPDTARRHTHEHLHLPHHVSDGVNVYDPPEQSPPHVASTAKTNNDEEQSTDIEDHPSTSRTDEATSTSAATASVGDQLTGDDEAGASKIASATAPMSNGVTSHGPSQVCPDKRVFAPRLNRTLDLSLTKLNGPLTAAAVRRSSRVTVVIETNADVVDRAASKQSPPGVALTAAAVADGRMDTDLSSSVPETQSSRDTSLVVSADVTASGITGSSSSSCRTSVPATVEPPSRVTGVQQLVANQQRAKRPSSLPYSLRSNTPAALQKTVAVRRNVEAVPATADVNVVPTASAAVSATAATANAAAAAANNLLSPTSRRPVHVMAPTATPEDSFVEGSSSTDADACCQPLPLDVPSTSAVDERTQPTSTDVKPPNVTVVLPSLVECLAVTAPAAVRTNDPPSQVNRSTTTLTEPSTDLRPCRTAASTNDTPSKIPLNRIQRVINGARQRLSRLQLGPKADRRNGGSHLLSVDGVSTSTSSVDAARRAVDCSADVEGGSSCGGSATVLSDAETLTAGASSVEGSARRLQRRNNPADRSSPPDSPNFDEKHVRFSHDGAHALDVFFSPVDDFTDSDDEDYDADGSASVVRSGSASRWRPLAFTASPDVDEEAEPDDGSSCLASGAVGRPTTRCVELRLAELRTVPRVNNGTRVPAIRHSTDRTAEAAAACSAGASAGFTRSREPAALSRGNATTNGGRNNSQQQQQQRSHDVTESTKVSSDVKATSSLLSSPAADSTRQPEERTVTSLGVDRNAASVTHPDNVTPVVKQQKAMLGSSLQPKLSTLSGLLRRDAKSCQKTPADLTSAPKKNGGSALETVTMTTPRQSAWRRGVAQVLQLSRPRQSSAVSSSTTVTTPTTGCNQTSTTKGGGAVTSTRSGLPRNGTACAGSRNVTAASGDGQATVNSCIATHPHNSTESTPTDNSEPSRAYNHVTSSTVCSSSAGRTEDSSTRIRAPAAVAADRRKTPSALKHHPSAVEVKENGGKTIQSSCPDSNNTSNKHKTSQNTDDHKSNHHVVKATPQKT